MPDLLTVPEVAKQLRCSKPHVYNLIDGDVTGVAPLPALRLGRRIVVRAVALQNWILQVEGAKILPESTAVDASQEKL